VTAFGLAQRLSGIACPHCDRRLDHARIEPGALLCPYCRRTFEAVRFDPVPLDTNVPRLTDFGREGANPCGSHRGNAAEVACTRCGGFICALCRIDVDRRILCPSCFDRMKGGGELPATLAVYRDYGRMAFFASLLTFVPVLGLVTGPAGLYWVWRARNEKPNVASRGSAALVWSAIVLSALGTLGAIAWLVALVKVF